MKRRARFHVMLVVSAIAGLAYARIARDWSFAEFLAGEAVVIILVGSFGLPWMEFAPDGAFRRRPQS